VYWGDLADAKLQHLKQSISVMLFCLRYGWFRFLCWPSHPCLWIWFVSVMSTQNHICKRVFTKLSYTPVSQLVKHVAVGRFQNVYISLVSAVLSVTPFFSLPFPEMKNNTHPEMRSTRWGGTILSFFCVFWLGRQCNHML